MLCVAMEHRRIESIYTMEFVFNGINVMKQPWKNLDTGEALEQPPRSAASSAMLTNIPTH